MDRRKYIQQVEQLHTHAAFEQETTDLLRCRAAQINKEDNMKLNKRMKIIIAAAVFICLLTCTVFAASLLLSPADVANRIGDTTLAAAFESEDAIIVNQTIQAGEYTVTFLGIVSGENISAYSDENRALTYAAFSISYTDGREMNILDGCPISISPFIEGYQPWCVNLFTISNGAHGHVENGVYYYLFSCDSLELFADHNIDIYIYEGHAPSSEIFSYDTETGKINYCENYNGIRGVFPLSLDSSEANPQLARQLLENAGFSVNEDGSLILED